MQDVIDTIEKQIAIADFSSAGFTDLAKRWASHSLETYRDELLTKALAIAKALSEFEAELPTLNNER